MLGRKEAGQSIVVAGKNAADSFSSCFPSIYFFPSSFVWRPVWVRLRQGTITISPRSGRQSQVKATDDRKALAGPCNRCYLHFPCVEVVSHLECVPVEPLPRFSRLGVPTICPGRALTKLKKLGRGE